MSVLWLGAYKSPAGAGLYAGAPIGRFITHCHIEKLACKRHSFFYNDLDATSMTNLLRVYFAWGGRGYCGGGRA